MTQDPIRFERGKDPRHTMRIGIEEKYKKVMNDVGYTYYGRILDPENWPEIEMYIERKMEWPKGTVRLSMLEEKNGVNIKISDKVLKENNLK